MLANRQNNSIIALAFLLLSGACLMTNCTHSACYRRVGEPPPSSPQRVPASLLDFHLQSLGRTPTGEQREVIEAALSLMQRYKIRTDSPLRSVRHNTKAREWMLDFDDGTLDGTFTIFLCDKSADWLDMLHTMLASRRVRFSPKNASANRK